ncbi:MAG: hypothetical protein K9N49_05760 [Candidatus Marinimicrobia bacterium]|nr:hypothetical protein [Candidatus Neomarinimicrobiota bacterium]
MNIILVILLIALVVASIKRKSNPETMTPVVWGLVIVVFVVVLARAFTSSKSSATSSIQPEFFTSTGYKLGQAVANAVPEGGDVLVVYFQAAQSKAWQRLVEAQLEGLKQELKAPKYKVIEAPIVPSEDEFEMDMGMIGAERFEGLLAQAPAAKAVVMFDCMFSPAPGQPAKKLPPLFLSGSPMIEMVDEFMARGLVAAAVTYRMDADWNAKPTRGMSLDEVFDLRYELRTR